MRLNAELSPEQIKAWRKALGLSIERAATLIGFSSASWLNWEKGRTQPPRLLHFALSQIAQLIRVHPSKAKPKKRRKNRKVRADKGKPHSWKADAKTGPGKTEAALPLLRPRVVSEDVSHETS